jgi:ATP-binding cassette, subfamily G (WHITE), member 2, SNQ2
MYVHVVIAFFTGVTFWQVGHTALDLQNRIFVIFQATILPAMVMMQVEPRYDFSRLIFIRENSSKMYSQFAFVVAVVVAEIPYGIMAAVLVIQLCYHLTCSTSSAFTTRQDSITALTEPVTSFS